MRARLLILVVAAGLATASPTLPFPVACASFTDDPIEPGLVVKAVYFTELRTCIAALRAEWEEPVFAWDGDIIPQVTEIRARHITELRDALAPVFAKTGIAAPTYSTITQFVTAIQAVHINELRSAVRLLDLPAASVPQFSPTPGTYGVEQNVSLSTSISGATIRYTLDGSIPWASATAYTGPHCCPNWTGLNRVF